MEEFYNNIKESFKEATLEFETINIKIDSTEWIEAHKKLRDEMQVVVNEQLIVELYSK